MPAYLIAELEVTDAALYDDYRRQVSATITAHSGRILVSGTAITHLEGPPAPQRQVVLEFPSMAQLQAWYRSPEYAPLIDMRQRASRARLVAVEGLPPG